MANRFRCAGCSAGFAIDVVSGMVYEPGLEAVLDARKAQQCAFRIVDAAFSLASDASIFVRVKLFTALDEGDAEHDVLPAHRCPAEEQTWSYSFTDGQIRRTANDIIKFTLKGPDE